MRKYKNLNQEKIEEVICNCCGNEMKVDQGIVLEGTCHLEINWGYFSNKDSEKHSFDLCEACYDKWVKSFKVPIAVTQENELL